MSGSFVLIFFIIVHMLRKMLYTYNYGINLGTKSESPGKENILQKACVVTFDLHGSILFDIKMVLIN